MTYVCLVHTSSCLNLIDKPQPCMCHKFSPNESPNPHDKTFNNYWYGRLLVIYKKLILVVGLNENQQKFINSTNVKKVVKFSLSFFIFSWKKFTFTPLYFELFLSYSLCVWFLKKKKKFNLVLRSFNKVSFWSLTLS